MTRGIMRAASAAGAASAGGKVPASEAGIWVAAADPELAAWAGAAGTAAGGGATGSTVWGGAAGSTDPPGATDAPEAGFCANSGMAGSSGDEADAVGVADTVGAGWVAVPSAPKSTTAGCGAARPGKTARPADAGGDPVGVLAKGAFTITGTAGEAQSLGILAPKPGTAADGATSATAVPGAPGRLATVGTGSVSRAIGCCCDVVCMNCNE
jgi:hypothetical protein